MPYLNADIGIRVEAISKYKSTKSGRQEDSYDTGARVPTVVLQYPDPDEQTGSVLHHRSVARETSRMEDRSLAHSYLPRLKKMASLIRSRNQLA